ncbi:MAG: hypothetical protein JWP97_376 [Labilithrix sp.]|nr:hypothetical protein [Labilithrix sp.]
MAKGDIGSFGLGHRTSPSLLRAVYTIVVLVGLLARPAAAAAQQPPRAADAGAPAGEEEESGDQTIDLSAEPDLAQSLGTAAPGATKPAEPARPDKLEFRGFTRLTAGAGLYPIPDDPKGAAPQERVPYDRAFAEQHLYLDLRYAHAAWFTAVASGSLSLSAWNTTNEASSGAPTTAVDLGKLDPILRELYVGFSLGRLDLRIGQQRIAWGNSDAYAPNDVLNGRDVRNPFLFDTEMLELPTPAVRADVDLSSLGVLSVVLEPFVPSDRFDLYGTTWAIIQPDAPRSYRRLFGTLSQGLNRSEIGSLQDTLSGGAVSGSNPANASIGGSLKTHVASVDLSWYVLSGFDRQPAVYVDPSFQQKLETTSSDQLNGGVFEALLNQTRASTKAVGGPVIVSYRRRNHVGMDAQTTVGPFVLRTDVAYDSAKTFFSAGSLDSVIHPVVQEVIGAEYQTGSLDRVVGVELWAMQVLGPEVRYVPALVPATQSTVLWYGDNNLSMAALVRYGFFDSSGIFELRSNIGIEPFWYSIRPEIGYQSPGFTVRAGVMAMGGASGSFGEYYRRNSTAYLTTRFSF